MARGESSASEPASQLVRRDLRAMNTDIELVCTGDGAERRLERAAKWLDAYEARFSRFKSTSELSALNASTGESFVASPQLYRLVELSLELARRSDGLFDPTILRGLEAAGYDRSFEQIPLMRGPEIRRGTAELRRSWRDVELDPRVRAITLPPAVGLDLGGIGKGWAVDKVASILGTPSLTNCGSVSTASTRKLPFAWKRFAVGLRLTEPLPICFCSMPATVYSDTGPGINASAASSIATSTN